MCFFFFFCSVHWQVYYLMLLSFFYVFQFVKYWLWSICICIYVSNFVSVKAQLKIFILKSLNFHSSLMKFVTSCELFFMLNRIHSSNSILQISPCYALVDFCGQKKSLLTFCLSSCVIQGTSFQWVVALTRPLTCLSGRHLILIRYHE